MIGEESGKCDDSSLSLFDSSNAEIVESVVGVLNDGASRFNAVLFWLLRVIRSDSGWLLSV